MIHAPKRFLAASTAACLALGSTALAQIGSQEFVSTPLSNQLQVIDGLTGLPRLTYTFPYRIYNTAVNPAGTGGLVTSFSGGAQVEVLDFTTNPPTLVKTIPLGPTFSPDVAVDCTNGNYAVVAPYNPGAFGGVPMSSIDLGSLTVSNTITLPSDYYEIDLAPNGSFVVAAAWNQQLVYVIDISVTGQLSVAYTLPTAGVPNAVDFSPVGTQVAVCGAFGINLYNVVGNTLTLADNAPSFTGAVVPSLAFFPDGSRVYGMSLNQVQRYDIDGTGAMSAFGTPAFASEQMVYFIGLNQLGVNSAGTVVAGHFSSRINYFDADTLTLINAVPSSNLTQNGGTLAGRCPTAPRDRLVYVTAPPATPFTNDVWGDVVVEQITPLGVVRADADGPVTLGIVSGNGTLSGVATVNLINGRGTFTGISYDFSETLFVSVTGIDVDPTSPAQVLVVPQPSDVAVLPSSIAANPAAPLLTVPATLSATVQNRGIRSVLADVRFYLGNPDLGGVQIGVTQFDTLQIGQQRTFTVGWTPQTEGPKVIYVVVDNLSPPEATPQDNRASRLINVASAPEDLNVVGGTRTVWSGLSTQTTVSIRNAGASATTLQSIGTGAPMWLTFLSPVAGVTLQPGETISLLATLDVPPTAVGAPLGSPPLEEVIQIQAITSTGGSFSGMLKLEVFNQPAASTTIRVVDDATSAPIAGALVSAANLGGNFTTDGAGQVVLGLPPGPQDVFAYQNGYKAQAFGLAIPEGTSTQELRLTAGDTLGIQTRVEDPLTSQEIIDRGINVSDPVNNIVVDFVVARKADSPLVFPSIEVPKTQPTGTTFEFEATASGGFGGGGGSGGGSLLAPVARATFTYTPYGRSEVWIIVPGEAQFLKEFFPAEILIVNNAVAPDPTDVQLRNIQASLSVPSGVSFPDLNGVPQAGTVNLGDLDAGESTTFEWIVRGDLPGSYTLNGNVSADLFAFGSTVTTLSNAANSGGFDVTSPQLRCEPQLPLSVITTGQIVPFLFDMTNEGTRTVNRVQVKLDDADLTNLTIAPTQSQATLVTDTNGQVISAIVDLGDLEPGETGRAEISLIAEVSGEFGPQIVETGCGNNPSPTVELTETLPVIDQDPIPVTACAGAPASFTVAASGSDLTYQWRKDGVDIVGATLATYTVDPTTPADAGAYDCVVSNLSGSVTSQSASLTVQTPAEVTQQPVDVTACVGTTVTFSVVATGSPAPTYQWRKNGVDIPGEVGPSLTVASAAVADAGVYECLASNLCGSDLSQPANLVVSVPPTITSDPVGGLVNEGEPYVLAVSAMGTGPLAYQWFKDGVLIGGADQAALSFPATEFADAGVYDCRVSNSCGQVISAAATVVINQLPIITCAGGVELWDPDHSLADVSSAFSVLDPDQEATTVSVRVFSDEPEVPETGDGSGRFAPDFKDESTGGRGLLVRSERRGKEDGRIYLAVITVTDARGGAVTEVCILAVCPRDQSEAGMALVQAEAVSEAAALSAALAAGSNLPSAGLFEHGLSTEIGPKQ